MHEFAWLFARFWHGFGRLGPRGPEDGPPALVIPGFIATDRTTMALRKALAAAGWTPYVASSGGPMEHQLARLGIRHLKLPLASKNPLVMRRNAAALIEIVRRHKIDIVHARSRAPAWSAWSAARATRRRFVTTFHNAYDVDLPLKHWYNSVMARGERVIAISQFVGEHVASVYGVGLDRLRVIPRGVDIATFDPRRVNGERVCALAARWRVPEDAAVVMLPGRLTRWKGGLDFIEAIARLGRRDLCCLLVGAKQHPGFRRELEITIERLGLVGMFRIVEDCPDMPAAYMLSDVVVSASTDPEALRAHRLKQEHPLLAATLRMGVLAPSRLRAQVALARPWAMLQGLNAPGVRVVQHWLPSLIIQSRLRARRYPLLNWPLLLNVREASALLALPFGAYLPGLTLGRARQLPPSPAIPIQGNAVGMSDYPGMTGRVLALRTPDRLRHVHLVGPTGVGKSTLLARMALHDIANGYGVIVIDLKGDLIRDIAARIPPARHDDADAGEHAVQRDQEADGADGGEAHVVEAGNRRADRRERRCDHEREQDGRQQGHDQLPRCAGAEREPAPRECCERGQRPGRVPAFAADSRRGDGGGRGGHGAPSGASAQLQAARVLPVRRR
jgi:hypothetical protein